MPRDKHWHFLGKGEECSVPAEDKRSWLSRLGVGLAELYLTGFTGACATLIELSSAETGLGLSCGNN